ncbi:hypothetical protein MMC14_000861 [Varicellaria rhodocarpa]|nr:hypothetical protein [Varicellaria rhodocarpa]
MQDFSSLCIVVTVLLAGFSGAIPARLIKLIESSFSSLFDRDLSLTTPLPSTIAPRTRPNRFIWSLPGTTITLVINLYQEIPQLKEELLSVVYDAGASLQHSIAEFSIATEPVPYDEDSMIRLRQVGSLILQVQAVSKVHPMTFEMLSEAMVVLHDFTMNKVAGSSWFEIWNLAIQVGKGRLLTQVPTAGGS